jgi:uncharacterized membrane protein (DUF373 family)
MRLLKRIYSLFRYSCTNKSFLEGIEQVEGFVAKVLSVVMVVVILVAVGDLIILLAQELFKRPTDFLDKTLLEVFGLFLNILIALELLENITAYLQKDTVLAELVIVTSLIAVARKIILLDLGKTTGVQIIGLAIALLTLSICYWIVRRTNAPKSD